MVVQPKQLSAEFVSEYLDNVQKIRHSNHKLSAALYYPDKRDIVGISGRQELPPLGLLYLAATLENAGVDVRVFPFNGSDQPEILKGANVVGYSMTATATYDQFCQLNASLQRVYQRDATVFVAGNTHATAFPSDVLRALDLDGVIPGEGELAGLKLFEGIARGLRNEQLFTSIPGAFFKCNGSVQRSAGATPRAESLEILPHPARHLLPRKAIVLEQRLRGLAGQAGSDGTAVTLITSRGCPFSCAFCGNVNNGSVRYRSREDLEAEVEEIKEQYPEADGLLIMDETATLTTAHVKNWTAALEGKRLPYVISTRGDVLDKDKVMRLETSGCWEVKFGVETGSQWLLDRMDKKLDLEKVSKALKMVKEHGIRTKVFLMHGFPGENRETTKATIDFMNGNREHIDRAVLYRFTPLPGSPVYSNPAAFDLNLSGVGFKDFTIYENRKHWWGTTDQFNEVTVGYEELDKFLKDTFER